MGLRPGDSIPMHLCHNVQQGGHAHESAVVPLKQDSAMVPGLEGGGELVIEIYHKVPSERP